MHPGLRPYFELVYPLFWPWLWFNLIRYCRWYQRTGISALLDIDRFGNIRIVYLADPPPADDLYIYDAPAMPSWAAPALASDLPAVLAGENQALNPSESIRTFGPDLRTVFGLSEGASAHIRAPPSGQTPTEPART